MTGPLWSGRLEGGLDPVILAFSASLDVDRRLLPYDLRASAVHVRMLARQGLIDEALAGRIVAALAKVEIEPDAADEDVHSAIERLLGDLGPAVHAGRSRNDQVQTAMRLWAMEASDQAAAAVRELGLALVARARATAARSCPATPTASARSRCGWGSTWPRTAGRSPATCGGLRQVRSAADVLPAGRGCARRFEPAARSRRVAQELGFSADSRIRSTPSATATSSSGLVSRPARCAGPPVAARRGARAVDVGGVRLRRLGEAYCSGSSMMPQKKNPDLAELLRGKAGRVVGAGGLLAT